MKLPDVLAEHRSYHGWLGAQAGYRGQIAFFSFLPGRTAGVRADAPGRYRALLRQLGLSPYQHQAEALAHTAAGRNVVVATPTASGKSLSYQVPTLEVLERGGHALYLFPTKALAFDQLEKLTRLADKVGLGGFVSTFDGDTPTSQRQGFGSTRAASSPTRTCSTTACCRNTRAGRGFWAA